MCTNRHDEGSPDGVTYNPVGRSTKKAAARTAQRYTRRIDWTHPTPNVDEAVVMVGGRDLTVRVSGATGDGRFVTSWTWAIFYDRNRAPLHHGTVTGTTGRERCVTAVREALGELSYPK